MLSLRWVFAGFTVLICALMLSSCAPGGAKYENILPVSTPNAGSPLMMSGWTPSPKPYAPNRVVLKSGGYKHARLLTFQTDMQDKARKVSKLKATVKKALKLEGIRNVKFKTVHAIKGDLLKAYCEERGLKDLTVRTWVVTGDSDQGKVKAIGVSLITSDKSDPGTSVEVFIAPIKEYERLGGYAVPATAMLRTMRLEPDTKMRKLGKLSDAKAARELARHTEALMAMVVKSDALEDMVDMQTMRIIMGLDQAVPYGLQDPMYEW